MIILIICINSLLLLLFSSFSLFLCYFFDVPPSSFFLIMSLRLPTPETISLIYWCLFVSLVLILRSVMHVVIVFVYIEPIMCLNFFLFFLLFFFFVFKILRFYLLFLLLRLLRMLILKNLLFSTRSFVLLIFILLFK